MMPVMNLSSTEPMNWNSMGPYHREGRFDKMPRTRDIAFRNKCAPLLQYGQSKYGEEEIMQQRFDYMKVAPGAYHAMSGLEKYLHESGLEESLLHLIKLRASQINGCAYCIDMHWKDAKAVGESDRKLYELNAWGECPFYSERERAALAWTEAVTRVAETHVPDEVYENVRKHFNEKELADLTLAIATINAWNRLAISARAEPGTYQAPKARMQKTA
jgi:AhpD family alkylhydroperoxidase